MSTLRQRQKRQRRQKILSSARTLFMKRGYSDTSLQQVAKLSEVSVPTIYNYFESKTNLLVSIAVDSEELLGQRLDQFIGNIPANPVEAVTEWLVLCIEGPLETLERELWSAIWLVELQTNHKQQLTQKLKDFHVSKSSQFLAAMQQRGQLALELDIDITSKLLDTIAIHFHRKIVIEGDATRHNYKRELERFAQQILNGLLPQPPAPE